MELNGKARVIVDFSGLCDLLGVAENTLRHKWLDLPRSEQKS